VSEVANFHVADLGRRGDLLATAEYGYAQLEQVPAAAELIVHFATLLYRSPEEFETAVPASKDLTFRWRSSAATAGIATLRCERRLTSLGLLASGLNRDADNATLAAFQSHLMHELRDTGFEPAFALRELTQRPLVVSIAFDAPEQKADQLLVALSDRCFAAAYFRYLHLV
jgi:hypothetical protein